MSVLLARSSHLRLWIRCFTLLASISIYWGCSIHRLQAADDFSIQIKRDNLNGKSLTGTISVNGTEFGSSMENEDYRIVPGSYKGVMRYQSQKYFVQGPNGKMDKAGDFLLEISGAKDWKGRSRDSLLFHGGTKPEHSEGCILLGAVSKSKNGKRYINEDHPLYKLRLMFYGTETPNSSPDKQITIEVIDTVDREELRKEKEAEEKKNAAKMKAERRPFVGVWNGLSGTSLDIRENGTATYNVSGSKHAGKYEIKNGTLLLTFSKGDHYGGWNCAISGGLLKCYEGEGFRTFRK